MDPEGTTAELAPQQQQSNSSSLVKHGIIIAKNLTTIMFPLIPPYPHRTWMIWSAQFVSSKVDIMVHLDLRLHIIIIQDICCPHHMAFLTSGTLFRSSPPIEIHFIMLIPPRFMGRV